jgi:hypothetical protein
MGEIIVTAEKLRWLVAEGEAVLKPQQRSAGVMVSSCSGRTPQQHQPEWKPAAGHGTPPPSAPAPASIAAAATHHAPTTNGTKSLNEIAGSHHMHHHRTHSSRSSSHSTAASRIICAAAAACLGQAFYKSARVEYIPVGVVGAIVPWNWPFHNIINPISAAVFAGNAIVIKVRPAASRTLQPSCCCLMHAAYVHLIKAVC